MSKQIDKKETKKDKVKKCVATQIAYYQNTLDSSHTKANLSRLRKGAGQPFGTMCDVTGLALGDDFPEELEGTVSGPSPAEATVYDIMTMYAKHQQSCRKPVHVQGKNKSFAAAVAKLMEVGNSKESLYRRFGVISSCRTVDDLYQVLLRMVELLKQRSYSFDYVELAGDIYDFTFEDGRRRVLRKWDRNFRKEIKAQEKKKKSKEGKAA